MAIACISKSSTPQFVGSFRIVSQLRYRSAETATSSSDFASIKYDIRNRKTGITESSFFASMWLQWDDFL